MARTNAFYGQGSGPINIDDPGCTGSERRLIDCPFSPIHNCAHSEDAGVDCVARSKISQFTACTMYEITSISRTL